MKPKAYGRVPGGAGIPHDPSKGIYEDSMRALNAIADVVMVYRPKPKTKPAKSRKRRAAKIAKSK